MTLPGAKLAKCPDCNGAGWIADSEGQAWCPRCDGRGITLQQEKAEP